MPKNRKIWVFKRKSLYLQCALEVSVSRFLVLLISFENGLYALRPHKKSFNS